jgi:hypothetical protein
MVCIGKHVEGHQIGQKLRRLRVESHIESRNSQRSRLNGAQKAQTMRPDASTRRHQGTQRSKHRSTRRARCQDIRKTTTGRSCHEPALVAGILAWLATIRPLAKGRPSETGGTRYLPECVRAIEMCDVMYTRKAAGPLCRGFI